MSESYNRLIELMNAWGQDLEGGAGSADQYRQLLRTTASWLAQGEGDATVVLRATQTLLLDPEHSGVRGRAALAALRERLQGDRPNIGKEPLLQQALLLASWPARPSGRFHLVPLLTSALQEGLLQGRPRQQAALQSWWEGNGEAMVAEREEAQAALQPPLVTPGYHYRSEQLPRLRESKATAWASNSYMDKVNLFIAFYLSGLRYQRKFLAARGWLVPEPPSLTENLNQLNQAQGSSWNFNNFAIHLIGALSYLEEQVQMLRENLNLPPSSHDVAAAFAHLQTNKDQPHKFNGVSDALLTILDWLEEALQPLPFFDIAGQVEARCRARMDGALARSARQTDLLWWGQARYCHLLRTPYRRLSDPDQILLAAAAEVTARAAALPSEPTAAFLVTTLAELGLDSQETHPLRTWLTRLQRALRDHPLLRPRLAPALAQEISRDALGLPALWACVAPERPSADAAATEVALPLDAPLDRGQWASWLLRELLVLRALQPAGGAA